MKATIRIGTHSIETRSGSSPRLDPILRTLEDSAGCPEGRRPVRAVPCRKPGGSARPRSKLCWHPRPTGWAQRGSSSAGTRGTHQGSTRVLPEPCRIPASSGDCRKIWTHGPSCRSMETTQRVVHQPPIAGGQQSKNDPSAQRRPRLRRSSANPTSVNTRDSATLNTRASNAQRQPATHSTLAICCTVGGLDLRHSPIAGVRLVLRRGLNGEFTECCHFNL